MGGLHLRSSSVPFINCVVKVFRKLLWQSFVLPMCRRQVPVIANISSSSSKVVRDSFVIWEYLVPLGFARRAVTEATGEPGAHDVLSNSIPLHLFWCHQVSGVNSVHLFKEKCTFGRKKGQHFLVNPIRASILPCSFIIIDVAWRGPWCRCGSRRRCSSMCRRPDRVHWRRRHQTCTWQERGRSMTLSRWIWIAHVCTGTQSQRWKECEGI